MTLFIDNDVCVLRQSRERWSASQNLLDTSLGEKTEHQHNLSRVAPTQSNMIGRDTSVMESTGHQEGWTECFQDLQTWCPPPQDELNTPQVTTDGFNFGTIDSCQVRDLDELYPVDLMSDALGGDMAYLQTSNFGLEEENNNTSPYIKYPQTSTENTYYGGKLYTSFSTDAKSPLKSTSANILLSQGILEDPQTGAKKESKQKTTMDYPTYNLGIPFDLADDEENYLSVPPDQVTKRVKDFRVPSKVNVTAKKERPKLKLNIAPPPVSNAVVMPSTPEVQNLLSEPKVGFDLIKYVVSGDYVNIGTVGEATPISKTYYNDSVRDHDYIDLGLRPATPDEPVEIKTEPLSPSSTNALDNNLLTSERGRPVKRRRDSNSDYVFDSDLEGSDDSADWEPSTSRGRKSKVKKAKISKSAIANLMKPDSDDESISSSHTTDRYRELRDKNNEASRRSRLNRKQRDMEMKTTADNLEAQNRNLRARAERMQKLVLDMREIIMKTIKGAKKG